MRCTKSGTSAIVAGKEFHAGIVLGKNIYIYLNVSDLAGYCQSFLECSALVRVLVGDRYASAEISTRSFTILKSMVGCTFVRLDSNVSL